MSGRLPWAAKGHCVSWPDLDTHGLAILSRATSYLPELKSVLRDEGTLRSHQDLWVEEKAQHGAERLPVLTDPEQAVHQAIKGNVRVPARDGRIRGRGLLSRVDL